MSKTERELISKAVATIQSDGELTDLNEIKRVMVYYRMKGKEIPLSKLKEMLKRFSGSKPSKEDIEKLYSDADVAVAVLDQQKMEELKEISSKQPEIVNPHRDDGKMVVDVSAEVNTLTQHTDICIKALSEVYNKPTKQIFVRNGLLSDITYDEKNNVRISDINRERLRNILDRCCNFVRYEQTEKGELIEKKSRAGRDIFENVLTTSGLHQTLPALFGMTEAPYITSEGKVVTAPGYDEETGIYFAPMPDYKQIVISENPSPEEVKVSVEHINTLFTDFPFNGDMTDDNGKVVPTIGSPDRANLLGAVLTSVLRPAIDGCTPLYLVDKPQMGTGGSLVCDVIHRIATGKSLEPSNAPKSNDGEEWEKIIVSILYNGSPSVCFDNIEGVFKSPALSSVLTSRSKKCRLLGSTNHTTYPVNVNWIGNGINLHVDGDLPRRVYTSRIVSQSSRPYQRTGFTIANLQAYVSEHRYEFIKDILTIAKAYHNAGKPEPKWLDEKTGKVVEIPTMGSFEAWRNYIGGMMVFIGMRTFLANTNEVLANFESQSDDDDILLERIRGSFQNREFSAKQITDDETKRFDEVLPSYIVNGTGRKARMLNTHLTHIRDKVYPSGVKVIRGKTRQKTQMWVIVTVGGEPVVPPTDYQFVKGSMSFTESQPTQ
jgi:hypothetical protein